MVYVNPWVLTIAPSPDRWKELPAAQRGGGGQVAALTRLGRIAAVACVAALATPAAVQAQPSGPRISADYSTVTEGDTGTDYQVAVEAHYPGTNYKVCFSGTATYGQDWTGTAATYDPPKQPPTGLPFGPGYNNWSSFNRTGCIEVNPLNGPPSHLSVVITVIGDEVVEGDEFIRATISPLTGGGASLTSEIRIVSDESPCTGDPFPLTEGENIDHSGGVCVMPAGTGAKDYSSVTAHSQTADGFFWGLGGGTLAWGGSSIDDNVVSGDRNITFEVDGKDDIVFARVLEDDISYVYVTYHPQRAAQPARWVERVCYQYAAYNIHFGCRSLIVTVEEPTLIVTASAPNFLSKESSGGTQDYVSVPIYRDRGDGQVLFHRTADQFNEAKAAAAGRGDIWPVTVEAIGTPIPPHWMKANGGFGFLEATEVPSNSGATIEDGIPFQHAGVTIRAGRQMTGGVRVSVASVTAALPILNYVPKVKGRTSNATSHVLSDAGQVEYVNFEKYECKGEAVHLRLTISEGSLNPLYDHVVLVDGVREGQPTEAQIIRIPICPQVN